MTASVGALAVPALELAVDGLPDAAQVLAARVASRFGTPDQCEVVIAGAIGWPAIPFGAALTLRVIGEDAALFTGEVTCVQMEFTPAGAVSARIRGYDVLHRLRKRQTLRVFEAVTVADVAEVLAGDLGLDVAVD
ncbi:MAG TPA: type IV secretion protein Rhs, partial [Micromonosporaceae bacterium]|nr:type IV secretion protein Rhs [Micromonosporaceae bacterium]